MADHIELTLGTPPWQPSSEANLVAIYHRYEMPLVGVLQLHGGLYLFACRYGGDDRLSVWAYSHIDDSDLRALNEVTDEDLLDRIREIERASSPRFGLALDDVGIVAQLDPEGDGNLLGSELATALRAAEIIKDADLSGEIDELVAAFNSRRVSTL